MFCIAVKPESTETLHLQASPDAQLKLTWDLPVGRIPRHCLEWQVEHNKEGPGGKIALVITINMLALIVTAGVLLQKFNCAEGDQHSSTFVCFECS